MKTDSTDISKCAKLSWILPLCFVATAVLSISISMILKSDGVVALIAILAAGVAFYIPAIKCWITAWASAEIRSMIFVHAILGIVSLLLPLLLLLLLMCIPGRTL